MTSRMIVPARFAINIELAIIRIANGDADIFVDFINKLRLQFRDK